MFKTKPANSLLDLGETEWPTDWFVIFCEARQNHWWHRILKEGFTHCYAIRWDGFNWIYVDPNWSCLNIAILDAADYSLPRVATGCSMLRVETIRTFDKMRYPWIVGPVTCVETVKALLGIGAFWVWTPWQLYRYLRRHHDSTFKITAT